MGLVAALVYICTLVLFIPFPFTAAFVQEPLAASVNPEYAPHRQVCNNISKFIQTSHKQIISLLYIWQQFYLFLWPPYSGC